MVKRREGGEGGREGELGPAHNEAPPKEGAV